MKLKDDAIRVDPILKEEGDGFLLTVPDLPDCMVEWETIKPALVTDASSGLKADLSGPAFRA